MNLFHIFGEGFFQVGDQFSDGTEITSISPGENGWLTVRLKEFYMTPQFKRKTHYSEKVFGPGQWEKENYEFCASVGGRDAQYWGRF